MKTGLKRIQTSLDGRLKEKTKRLSSTNEYTKDTMANAFEYLREEIDKRENFLQQQIRVIETTYMTLFDHHQIQLQKQQELLNSQSSGFQKILSTNDHTKLLKARNGLFEYLEKTTKDLRVLQPPAETECWADGLNQFKNIGSIIDSARIVNRSKNQNLFIITVTQC